MLSINKEEKQMEKLIWNSVRQFESWLADYGYSSYDPYDIWGSKFGVISRRIFYYNQFLGLFFIAPILLIDTLIPQARRFFLKKQRFATADAQLLIAFLNLFQITRNEQYLTKSIKLADELIGYSIPGYSGYCWGYPFDWQHSGGFWKKNTPYITATPYCFEAILYLFDNTLDSRYWDTAASIARFVAQDLKDTPTSARAAAGSYSPIDNSKVVNASAYRAMVLIEASHRFNNSSYYDQGIKNLNFILENQNKDGSWLYAIDLPKNAFIDHFHTCFVLKNLIKMNAHLQRNDVTESIRRGYVWYRRFLFEKDETPRSFAIKPRVQIVNVDFYNFAEAITLGILMRKEIPEAFHLSCRLAARVASEYQLNDGHFVTKIYLGWVKNVMPYMRWSQTQMFLALTNLLKALNG
jgi:hypothetical protein